MVKKEKAGKLAALDAAASSGLCSRGFARDTGAEFEAMDTAGTVVSTASPCDAADAGSTSGPAHSTGCSSRLCLLGFLLALVSLLSENVTKQ